VQKIQIVQKGEEQGEQRPLARAINEPLNSKARKKTASTASKEEINREVKP